MATQGPRYSLLLLCLAAVIAGCQGVPPVPGDPTTRPEGVLAADPNPGTTAAPRYDPAVQKASAVQPLPSMEAAGKGKPSVVYLADDTGEAEEAAKSAEEEPSGFSWSDLAFEEVYKDLQVALGYGPDHELARKYFEQGLAFYRQKRFKKAAAKFKAAAGRWPDSLLEEDALFLQGESLFFADAYSKAHDAFGNLLKKHDNSRHLDKIMIREFSIGRYWDQLHAYDPHWPITPNVMDSTRPRFDTLGNARKAYETVALNDPTGPLADDALMALAGGYFVQGRYQDASEYYDRLRKEHPNSKHIIDAHLLTIKSKQMMYQGPLYDAAPLKETGEVAEQTLRQFGPQLGEERDNLIKIQNRVDADMAQRDWAMAKFYEGKKQYGGARYYYRQIVKDHPETEMARAAQQRLDEIKEFPDKPPNRFKLLTNLFPDDR